MFVLLIILQFIETFSVNPRGVQINLETSFLFRPKDFISENSPISSLRTLLVGLDKYFRPDPVLRTGESGELSKFLKYVGTKLIQQDDVYLGNLTSALKSAIYDFYNRSNQNSFLKNKVDELHITDILDGWEKLSVKDIKANIKRALYNDNTIVHKIVRHIDRFYNETDAESLSDIAAHITGEIKNSTIDKIVRGALNFIIFKRLRGLNDTARDSLFGELHQIINSYSPHDKVKIMRATDKLKKKHKFKGLEIPSIRSYKAVKEKLQETRQKLKESYLSKHGSKETIEGKVLGKTENASKPKDGFVLKIEAKDGGLQISIPNTNVKEEIKPGSVLKIENEKSKKSNERAKENTIKSNKHENGHDIETNYDLTFRGKGKSNRRSSDLDRIDLIKQEGDLLLKQVEEEVNKIYNNSQNADQAAKYSGL